MVPRRKGDYEKVSPHYHSQWEFHIIVSCISYGAYYMEHSLKKSFSDTKYEERKYGKHRRLIIKNLSMGDFSYMACESRGQRLVRYFTYDEQQ